MNAVKRRKNPAYRKKRYAAALPGVVLLAAASYVLLTPAITVVVENVGAQTLTSVVVVAGGKRHPVGDVAPGELRQFSFDLEQDSSLTLVSDAGKTKVNIYLTPGYTGEISVSLEGRKLRDFDEDLRVSW